MFESHTPRNFIRKNQMPSDERGGVFSEGSNQLDSKFSLVEDELGVQELFLSSHNEEGLCLNDYLPKGVEFRGGPKSPFSCGTQSFEHPDGSLVDVHNISFDTELIDSVQGRLALLHEIGHAVDNVENSGLESVELRYLIKRIGWSIFSSADYMWTDDPQGKQEIFLEEFRVKWREAAKEYSKESGLKFRYKDLIGALSEIVRSERDAWSNGIRLYRKIKSESEIDLLEGADTSEIFDTVHRALASYERAYGSILDDYNSKGPLKKFIEGNLT